MKSMVVFGSFVLTTALLYSRTKKNGVAGVDGVTTREPKGPIGES